MELETKIGGFSGRRRKTCQVEGATWQSNGRFLALTGSRYGRFFFTKKRAFLYIYKNFLIIIIIIIGISAINIRTPMRERGQRKCGHAWVWSHIYMCVCIFCGRLAVWGKNGLTRCYRYGLSCHPDCHSGASLVLLPGSRGEKAFDVLL